MGTVNTPPSTARSWRPGRSVRSRLTFAIAGVVAIVVVGAGIVLVRAVHSALVRPITGEARARAADVVAMGTSAVRLPEALPNLAAPWRSLVQVLGADDEVLAASADLVGEAPLLAADAIEP